MYLTLHAAERFGWRRALPLGAVIGLGILGNVRLEGLPFLLGAYLLWRSGVSRRTLLATAALFAGAALLVMPWVVRNKVSVGCWAVTTDARALWKANNVNTYVTLKHGGWIDHVPQPKSFPPTPQDVFDHWKKTGVVVPYNECAQMNEFQHKVISFWIHHPGDKAKLVPLDAQWLWQPSVVETRGRPGAGSWLDTVRTTAEPAYMIPLYILGADRPLPRAAVLRRLAVLLLGYQTLVAMLFVGETRYRVPWDFLIALLAARVASRRAHRASASASPASRRRPSTAATVTSAMRRLRVEQVVVVEVRVHVRGQRPEHGARELSERMRRRQHAGRGSRLARVQSTSPSSRTAPRTASSVYQPPPQK